MIVTTTHGPQDEADLEKREGADENDNEIATWVEYWMRRDGPCEEPGHDMTISSPEDGYWERVHRSAHVTLKRMPPAGAQAGGVG